MEEFPVFWPFPIPIIGIIAGDLRHRDPLYHRIRELQIRSASR